MREDFFAVIVLADETWRVAEVVDVSGNIEEEEEEDWIRVVTYGPSSTRKEMFVPTWWDYKTQKEFNALSLPRSKQGNYKGKPRCECYDIWVCRDSFLVSPFCLQRGCVPDFVNIILCSYDSSESL